MKSTAALLALAILTQHGMVVGQSFTPVRYDFDGPTVPAEWRIDLGADQGTQSVQSGSLVLAPFTNGGVSSIAEFAPDRFIAETRIRFLDDRPREDWASLAVRMEDPFDVGYTASLSSEGNLLLARVIPRAEGGLIDPNKNVTA
ncbi:MAG: hypothetical protein AAF961_13610, partial [Planctomycetota bacterium]